MDFDDCGVLSPSGLQGSTGRADVKQLPTIPGIMSLITRCPACGTMFKVVADQLRVSQGWVRCGNCSDVFDAGTHLQPVNLGPSVSLDTSAASSTAVADVPTWDELSPPAAVNVAPALPSAEPTSFDAVAPVGRQHSDPVAPPDVSNDTAAPAGDTECGAPSEAELAFEDVSFVRQARRQAFWNQTSVRVVSGVAGLVLAALLGAQWILQQKDRLVLLDTRWSPVLQTLCQPLKCEFKPLRRVESLVIDSSTFSKAGPESFRLSFVLKNMADLPLEAPLLELTLTDTQDKAILRRVLTPAQFGYAAGALLPARAETAGVVSFSMPNDGNRPSGVSAAAVAGYRVLVFYP